MVPGKTSFSRESMICLHLLKLPSFVLVGLAASGSEVKGEVMHVVERLGHFRTNIIILTWS
jgi:hypothetical protein